MEYKVYAFDFDLTLADTISVSEKTYAAAFSAVGKSFDGDVFHHLTRDLKASFYECADGGENYPAFLSAFESTAENIFHEVVLYPDVIPALGRIRSGGAKTALVTNRNIASVEKAMAKYGGAKKYFDYMITGDITTNFKPHPEPILKCLALSGVSRSEFVYFGDAENDFLSASAAGVDFVFVNRNGKVAKRGAITDFNNVE